MSLYVLSYWGAGTEYIIFKFAHAAKQEKGLFSKWMCHSDKLLILRDHNLLKSTRKNIHIPNSQEHMKRIV